MSAPGPPPPSEPAQAGGEPATEPAAAGPAAAAPPAGWYPDPAGQMRWWDGQQWGQVAQPAAAAAPNAPFGGTDPKTIAMLAQLLGLLTGFVAPLVIYLINGNNGDRFVRHHSSEALNFQITYLIATLVSVVLIFVLIGLLLLPALIIAAVVLQIMASVAAYRGEWYRYPLIIRFVPGAAG